MCQLLGLCSNKDVDIQVSLREFRHRGRANYHGWGFAFYSNSQWKIIKEPKSLGDENIESESFKFKSKIIIGHVRLASCGKDNHLNTHPFEINKWVFAHNGTVSDIMENGEFLLTSLKPIGKTDSEYAFCYLLEKIRDRLNIKEIFEVLKSEANKIKDYGKFNFLLSNGEVLFAHGDNSLYYVQRKTPFQEVTLKDEKFTINLAEIKAPDEKAILIATEPLTTNESWIKFSGVKIFKDGEEIKE